MNEKIGVRAKALEIAAIILGPAKVKPVEQHGAALWKVNESPISEYLLLAKGIEKYLPGMDPEVAG